MSPFRSALACSIAAVGLVALSEAPAQAQAQARAGSHALPFGGLHPGQFDVLNQQVPVRVVFVGYTPQQIDKAEFAGYLPATYKPVVRYPQFYGLQGRDLGLAYGFRHSVEFKSQAFNNRFFAALTAMGKKGAPTAFQLAYNAQTKNVLDVGSEVLYIDAPAVERWLKRNDARDDKGYTIYFVNWYGRPDFKFHVYEKTDEPDPDTKYNFGAERASRRMIAWGGSSSRLWFYDLSAGPESWAGNYNLDNANLDGDLYPDYRIPPIWEYAAGAYRDPSGLSGDLGLVARFVAVNLLFTNSPLYDPLVTAPGLLGAKVAHVAMLENDADPKTTGLDHFDARFMKARFQEFQPYYPWRVGETLTNPIDSGAKAALDTFSYNDVTPGCWNAFGTPFAAMFCYFDENRATYFPAYGPRDYVGGIASFNTSLDSLGVQAGLLGFADDNWIDGTPSYVFTFGGPEYRESGYGFTSTAVHEFGHHIGMSHPHDGYDSELTELTGDLWDYGASGDLYFAWSGDESDTVMQYISVSNGFGQFDQDNSHRWETAGYLNWSNALAEAVVSHPQSHRVRALVAAADLMAAHGTSQFRKWNYLESAAAMRQAYQFLLAAAGNIGATSPALERARTRMPDAPRRQTCTVRFPNQ